MKTTLEPGAPPLHGDLLARQIGPEDDPLRVGEKPVLRPRHAQPIHLRLHPLPGMTVISCTRGRPVTQRGSPALVRYRQVGTVG